MNNKVKSLVTATVLGVASQFVIAGAAQATPDLRMTNLKVLGKAQQGKCTKVTLTVKNIGTSTSGGAKGAIITFPKGSPNLQRSLKKIYVAPLRPGRSVTMTVSRVPVLPLGDITVQATINAPQTFVESNFNNNNQTHHNSVLSACYAVGNINQPVVSNLCDLELKFIEPTGSTIAQSDVTPFKVQAKNVGSGACAKKSVRLYRYSGSTGSGYGSAVGGTSGSIRQIPALSAGQAEVLEWPVNPSSPGTFTYKTKFMGTHNDANNSNHRPKKTVVVQ